MKIRIKFKKYGPMKFIGHLDVMRYFQKAMRRAGVDICYSGGFSPHQIMSFASPLGVGVTSQGEYVDIEVNSTESSAAMVERLNAVMPRGLPWRAGDFSRMIPKPPCPWWQPRTTQSFSAPDTSRRRDCGRLVCPGGSPLDAPAVLIDKKDEKGDGLKVDLKPLVYEIHARSGETPALFMKVSAGSLANVKPQQVLDAFYQSLRMEQAAFCPYVPSERRSMRTWRLKMRGRRESTASSPWKRWDRILRDGQADYNVFGKQDLHRPSSPKDGWCR